MSQSHIPKPSTRLAAAVAFLIMLAGACTAAQAKVPKCGTAAARMAAQYELTVRGHRLTPEERFKLTDPGKSMSELLPTGYGMSNSEFKKIYAGDYYEWFALEALQAYSDKRTDYLEFYQETKVKCILKFRQVE